MSQLFGVGRKRLPILGTLPANLTFDGRSADTEFFLMESSGDEAIMGLDLLMVFHVTLYPVTDLSGADAKVMPQRSSSSCWLGSCRSPAART